MLIKARTPGLVIRPAQPGDAARLVAVERESPVAAGRGVSFNVDKVDALGLARLQPESVVLVAELDGEIVGMHSASIHDGMIAGQRRRLAWIHYARVALEQRGKWIGHSLQAELTATCQPRVDHCYQLHPTGRDPDDGQYRWRKQPVWLLLDAVRVGGPPHGRSATPDDAELIVEMLNAGHSHEELFAPRTVASLRARMEHAPEAYSWGNLIVGNGAVIGVWRGGWRVVRNHQQRAVAGAQGNVVDYGFLPGAEGELLRLLRAACGAAEIAAGSGYLGLWTSVGSRAYTNLAVLAGREFHYELHCDIPEPAGAGPRGVYLDGLHST